MPSGRSAAVSLLPGDTVGDLKVAAQRSLGQGFLRLARDGRLLNPEESLQSSGLQDGDCISAVAQQVKIAATRRAFALWCVGGDKIVTWGDPRYGGDSTGVGEMCTSTIVTSDSGGDTTRVERKGEIRNLKEVRVSQRAFAALTLTGTLVTWGSGGYGGGMCEENVQSLHAVAGGFRARIIDGLMRKEVSRGRILDFAAIDRVCEEFNDVMPKGHFSQTSHGTADQL